MKQNKRYKIILMLLITIFVVSSYYFIKEVAENKKENDIYEDLQNDITEEDIEIQKNENQEVKEDNLSNNVEKTKNKNNKELNQKINLENLYKKNNDLVGWLKIDGTNINYPVMQSNLENGNYYLHRNLYKKYSKNGTPYLASYCDLKSSDNLIIYGHNMKNNTMFSNLVKYKNYDFYKKHKYIKFYTLPDDKAGTKEQTYEIAFVFKTTAYSDNSFNYYNYTNFENEKELNAFIESCKNIELYNTKTVVNYGDKLITLSTCEYSQKNGRMVVVAKQVN